MSKVDVTTGTFLPKPKLEISHYLWLQWFESPSCVLTPCFLEMCRRTMFLTGSQQQRWRHTLKSRMCNELYFLLISTRWGSGCLPGHGAHSTGLLVMQEPIALFGNSGVHATQTVKCHHCLLLDKAYLIKAWQIAEPKSTQICCSTLTLSWNQLVFLKIIQLVCSLRGHYSLLTKRVAKWLVITFHQSYVGSARSEICLQVSSSTRFCDVTNAEIRFHWQIK